MQKRFEEARLRVLADREVDGGIGVLAEKTLHRIVKLMLEPDASRHEVAVDGSIVDILSGGVVTEVQTRSFYRLLPKLKKLLPTYSVNVVYPIARVKMQRIIDPNTGEITPPRKSPKKGAPRDAIRELSALRPLLGSENLRVTLLFFDIEEYRTKGKQSRGGKVKTRLAERIPTAYAYKEELCSAQDYVRLYLPDTLRGDPFTAKSYAKAIGLKERYAYAAIRILMDLGLLSHVGNEGRAYLYQTTEKCKESFSILNERV